MPQDGGEKKRRRKLEDFSLSRAGEEGKFPLSDLLLAKLFWLSTTGKESREALPFRGKKGEGRPNQQRGRGGGSLSLSSGR